MKKIKEILILALCITSVVSFSEETTPATPATPITKEEVEKMIADAVKAQTEKMTNLQKSITKNTQDIQNNKIHYFSAEMGLNGGGNFDNDGAKGSPLSLAIGANSRAIGKGSAVAIGNHSTADGVGAISIGYYSKALNQVATAIGYQATVSENNPGGLAIGVNTAALGESSMTLGLFSRAIGARSASIGYGAKSIGKSSLAVGDWAIANGDSGIAIGKNSLITENSEYSIVLGPSAYVGNRKQVSSSAIIDSGNGSVVDGNNTASTGTPGSVRTKAGDYTIMNPAPERVHNNSIAIGLSAKVYGYQSIAIGGTAEASKSDSLAIGTGSESRGHFSSALGAHAIANSDHSIALGYFTYAGNKKSITIGDNSRVQVDGGISLGSTSFNNRSTETLGYDFSENHTKLITSGTEPKMELQGDMKTKYDALDSEVKELQKAFDAEEGKYNNLIKQRDTFFAINVKEQELQSLKNSIANEKEEAKKQKLEEEKTKLEAELNKDKATLTELQASSGLTVDAEVRKAALKQSEEVEKKLAALDKKKVERNKVVSTWKGTSGALSVGNEVMGVTRQIIGVAAGTADTDAVNVAQLRSMNLHLVGDSGETRYTIANKNPLKFEGENGIITKVEDGKVKISLNINDKNLTVTKPTADETTSPKLDLSEAIKEKIEKLENVAIKAGTGIAVETSKESGTTTYTINADLSSVEGKIATNTKNIEELEKKISNTSSNEKMKEIENKSYSGISNAIAMANLPVSTKDKFSIAAGYGTYMGNHSLAIGFMGNKNLMNYKASISLNSKGNLGFGVGVAYILGTKDEEEVKLNKELARLNQLEKESKEKDRRINDLEKKLEEILNKLK
ncbi:YadA-like family protein [Pseudostreptobacillus hongkongensis]|uniref:YadA-like family protein n=1 Tax=Pseudostreptobacillus hongkongensis TaxID=1162717 RepID=UPI000836A1E7|nr:YadA-like family protein [Pseudostreptobacillus hongkongensis]